ncbi:MAG: serine/threonine-protein kinase [Planctomycetota bacterium]
MKHISLFDAFDWENETLAMNPPPGDLAPTSRTMNPAEQPDADSTPPGDVSAIPEQLGPYAIHREIGRGAMGAVYLATHTNLLRRMAVKVLPPRLSSDQSLLKRFQREMVAIGRLEHDNIVFATDAGHSDGVFFIAMQYIEGSNLEELLALEKRIDPGAACEMMSQAAAGLQHLYENQLVHRDVKPSNFMLTRQGRVKILDLGIAMLRQDSSRADITSANAVMGTPDFMAPEQVNQFHSVDIRADIYSLGCTLYTLLAGQPPFSGPEHSTYTAKLVAHAHEQPEDLESLCRRLPAGLADAVATMMSKSPADRPGSPQEVVELMQPWADDDKLKELVRSVDHRTTDDAPKSPKWRSKTKSPDYSRLAGIGVAVAFLLVGVAWLLSQESDAIDGAAKQDGSPVMTRVSSRPTPGQQTALHAAPRQTKTRPLANVPTPNQDALSDSSVPHSFRSMNAQTNPSTGTTNSKLAAVVQPQTLGDDQRDSLSGTGPQAAGRFRPQAAGRFRPQTAGRFRPQTAGRFRPQTLGGFRPQTLGGSSAPVLGSAQALDGSHGMGVDKAAPESIVKDPGTATSIDGSTTKDSVESIAASNVGIERHTKQIADTLGELREQFRSIQVPAALSEPRTPGDHYHNACIYCEKGDYGRARKAFLDYFAATEIQLVDPHLRFVELLKLQEGIAGARDTVMMLPGNTVAPARTLVVALLESPPKREVRLRAIVETNERFAPAYYYLSKEFSRASLGPQTFAEIREEKRLLKRFLELSDQGQLVRHFLDQRKAIRMMEEARSRLVSTSAGVAESVLENPVTFSVVQPLKDEQWMFFLNIAERCTEIWYREGEGSEFQATKPIPGISNIDHRTGKPCPNYRFDLVEPSEPITVSVKYVDGRGVLQGPFDYPFDPDARRTEIALSKLKADPREWIRFYEDGTIYLDLLNQWRAIKSMRYSFDHRSLDRERKLPTEDYNDDNFDEYYRGFEVPEVDFMAIQLEYVDGTKSNIETIKRRRK